MTILQTADLKKYYGQGTNLTKALDGVDLSVEQGEFLAVVGTSGSGKSTLLHMMGGLDTPTSGSIKVRGKELAEMNDEQLTIFRILCCLWSWTGKRWIWRCLTGSWISCL